MEMLYVLNKDIKNVDNIYIYGSGEFSVDLMTYLLQLNIIIKGFTSDDLTDCREKIFNKPIYKISDLKLLNNITVLIPSIYSENEYYFIKNQGFEEVYWSQLYKKTFVNLTNETVPKAFDINPGFLNKGKKVVYGAGVSGKQYYKLLREHEVRIDAFGDSNQVKWGKRIEDLEVISIDQMSKYKDNLGIVIPPAFTADIYNKFEKQQQRNSFLPPTKYGIFIEKNNGVEELLDITVIQKIIDQSKGKKVVVYGDSDGALKIGALLKNFLVEVEYFTDSEKCTNSKVQIKNLQDMLIENLKRLLFIIPDFDLKTRRKKIESLKILFEKVNYISIGDSDGRTCQYIDTDLGYNAYMDKMGFKIYKRSTDKSKKNFRILTLGNSTTYAESKWTIQSWSEQLFEKICTITNVNIEIMCGGINHYNSHDELIKLIRDGLVLKPDMVISYSGVNDMGFIEGVKNYPHLRPSRKEQFNKISQLYSKKNENTVSDTISYGLENNKKDYEYWLDNIRMMHAICKEFNILFYSILQPTVLGSEYQLSQSEAYIIKEEFKEDRAVKILQYADEFYTNAIEMIKTYDYIIDFTNIFSGKTGMFYDPVHVKNEGNKIIADKIYELVSDYIK